MRRIMSMEADTSCGSDDIAIYVVADLAWECEESRRHILIVGSVEQVGNLKMWTSIDDDVLRGEAGECPGKNPVGGHGDSSPSIPKSALPSNPRHSSTDNTIDTKRRLWSLTKQLRLRLTIIPSGKYPKLGG
jgi:hypothetical protein